MARSIPDAHYEVVIRPRPSWLHFEWRAIIQYRDLLYLLVRRDFVARYQQTILGPSWFVINPLITTVVFSVIFGRVVGISTNGIHPTLFYLSGLLAWSYFAQVISGAGNALQGNVGLFGKVYFPRLIVPLAVVFSAFIAFGIQLITFVVVFIYLAATNPTVTSHPTLWAFALPLILLHTAVFGFGVSLVFSSISAKYRDLQQLTPYLMQIWMYATPIIYPLSKIPEKFRWVALLNPLTCVTEAIRSCLLGSKAVALPNYALSIVLSLLVCAVGILMFQRSARDFVDYA